MQRNGLILKFMTSTSGEEIITIHILPTILTKKGNQAMKLDQLIKHKGNVFPQKPCSKCDFRLFLNLILKNQN